MKRRGRELPPAFSTGPASITILPIRQPAALPPAPLNLRGNPMAPLFAAGEMVGLRLPIDGYRRGSILWVRRGTSTAIRTATLIYLGDDPEPHNDNGRRA